MVDSTDWRASPGGVTLDAAIEDRLEALEAGNSRRATRTALERFASFLRRERAVHRVDELDAQDCRRWAQQLRRDVHDGAISGSTAQQYYARVRASCTWWFEDERIDTNPAKAKRAQDELPEDTTRPERQSWSREQREQLLRTADRLVDESQDDHADGDAVIDDVLRAHRDRTLAYLFAWSGVRGGEVLRDPMDDERDGVTWLDVDDSGVLELLGKTRQQESAPLRRPVLVRLDRWRRVLDPPSDDWPVFPQLSKGVLRSHLERERPEADLEPGASVRERLDALAAHGVVPAAISTNAGRSVMQRLSRAADVDVEEGYLRPHGGRRGLGGEIYDEDPVVAQDTLRHESIETTNEAYREKNQAQRAARLDEMFGDG